MESFSESPDLPLEIADLEEFPGLCPSISPKSVELVQNFSTEPIVSQFFEKQNDSQNQNYKRSYTQYIEKELQNLESDSVQDCIFNNYILISYILDVNEANNLISLHQQILFCDSTLQSMSNLLTGFKECILNKSISMTRMTLLN